MPLGMHRRKKLSDFFVDAGIPAHDKYRYPLLTAADGTIVWVCGSRIDERFKITDSTSTVLRLQFQRESEQTHGEKPHRQR
jgi:tRNA(Ile)-lysidine synthase